MDLTKESFRGATLNFTSLGLIAPSPRKERTPNGTLAWERKFQQCAIRRPTQARHLQKLTGAASMDFANGCPAAGLGVSTCRLSEVGCVVIDNPYSVCRTQAAKIRTPPLQPLAEHSRRGDFRKGWKVGHGISSTPCAPKSSTSCDGRREASWLYGLTISIAIL